MSEFYELDKGIIEKNDDELIHYSELRKRLLKHKEDPFYEDILKVLDLTAEIVNGDGSIEHELQDAIYYILS